MLTDKQIDQLLAPIVNNERKATGVVLKRFGRLIRDIGNLSQADLNNFVAYSKSVTEVKSLENQLDEMNKLQSALIKDTLLEIAEDAYSATAPLYKYRKMDFPRLNKNVPIWELVDQEINDILDLCFLILVSKDLLIRDLGNPGTYKRMSLQEAYLSVQQECLQARQTPINYMEAMSRTTQQLADSGLRSTTNNGRSQEIDVAMRSTLLEGVKNVQQKINDAVGEQVQANGKEISVHIDSAPDHEPVQGHQFTDEEFAALQNNLPFRDIVGVPFEAIQRPIGAWNCRHYTYAIIVGVTAPKYSLLELELIKEENANGITLQNGRHLSRYECSQEQRRLERKIRRYKKQQIIAVSANDKKLATSAQIKINNAFQEYVDFSNYCGLQPEFDRAEVPGYRALNLVDYTY